VKVRIKLLNRQASEIKNEITLLIQKEQSLAQSVQTICSVPGVGILTAATVLAETNGFELINVPGVVSTVAPAITCR
jgi:endonuclease III